MDDKCIKLVNYRQIDTCANCGYCEDKGIDEEVLSCLFLGKLYAEEIDVDHDGICDGYTKWKDEPIDIHQRGVCLDTKDGSDYVGRENVIYG